MPFALRRPGFTTAKGASGMGLSGGLLPLAVILAACGLPQQGPRTSDVLAPASAGDYALVDVSQAIAEKLGTPPRRSLQGFGKGAAAAPSNAVGIGDTLDIRILEAGTGGLFGGASGGTEFPGLVVDRAGQISLPYIGSLPVAGHTPVAIEAAIVEALRGKAIEPQALVRISRSETNRATVAGDAATPGPYPLRLGGDRVSQAIAAAGGSRFPAHETRVTLVRGGRTASARLSDVLLLPASDIALQRDDMIVLTHEPPRYTLTGSVRRPGTFKFETPDYSVLEALAAAGGATDTRADPTGVFLFRLEPRDRLAATGRTDLDTLPQTEGGIPTVYRFDLSDPATQFTAARFQLTDGDALYVSNAPMVQLDKVLDAFNLGLSAARRAQILTE
ncbi:polysaccharide biosynthesis/export family protein [Tabrizicola sp. M-4]|uniref:polysaccharide biosynthesis/export family protein n=1 Tax=Tabrizicola sp. M-4 TaxID=3055847 RepID=UPI003DA9926C